MSPFPLEKQYFFKIPEICDYELRRIYHHNDNQLSLARLNRFIEKLGLIEINRKTMLMAAELWAQARKKGRPTAADTALDEDVILAAQAKILEEQGYKVMIATENVKHISLFVEAKHWSVIE